MTRKVIMDVDTGSDDACAIILAALSKEIDLLGVVAVNGNRPLSETTRNTLMIVELLKMEDKIPVVKGASAPMIKGLLPGRLLNAQTPSVAYDEDGNEICYHPAKFDLPEPKTKLVDKNFISWYIDTILGSEEKVTLVAVGPLTDLGLLFRVEPKVLENIEEIVIMGGGHNQVNTTSAAEFNIYADPEAAEIVMQSGAKITMVPLDATHAASTYLSEVQAYRDMHSSVGDMVADLIEIRTNAYNKLQPLWAKDLCPLHDALAVAYLIDPNVLKNVLYTRVDVDISGGFADGHTIVDTRVKHNLEDNCYFALDADRDLFNKIMIERVGLFKD
ncbi:MAG: nucleoside hydrolase [Erysipelotrichaceae bacterium]|nr:nucleoside hydrolase [Erysipelotrichaceae bacterium]